jgi:pSer/pThr/pTyr-binding forkhead associated (FHA) protein
MGVDYRIYEGSNTIGRDPENTITITKDPTISGEHVNILYRNGKFYIKDKMTANGTYLNGEELEVEKAYDLIDGDLLRFGNTEFKFKSYE